MTQTPFDQFMQIIDEVRDLTFLIGYTPDEWSNKKLTDDMRYERVASLIETAQDMIDSSDYLIGFEYEGEDDQDKWENFSGYVTEVFHKASVYLAREAEGYFSNK